MSTGSNKGSSACWAVVVFPPVTVALTGFELIAYPFGAFSSLRVYVPGFTSIVLLLPEASVVRVPTFAFDESYTPYTAPAKEYWFLHRSVRALLLATDFWRFSLP